MKKKSGIVTILVMALLVLGMVLAVFIYSARATDNARDKAKDTLRDNAQEQAVTLRAALTEKFVALEAIASSIKSANQETARQLFASSQNVINGSDIYAAYVINAQGDVWASFDGVDNVADRAYFQQAMSGERAMQMITGKISNENLVMLAAPIHDEAGSVIGVMSLSYAEKGLRQFIESSTFGGESYSYVVDSSGKVIVGTDSKHYLSTADNIFDTIASASFQSDTTADDIRASIAAKESNSLTCTMLGEERLIVFAPMATEKVAGEVWFIVNVVSMEEVDAGAADEKRSGIELVVIVLIFAAMTGGYYTITDRRNRKRLEQESKALRTENQRFNIVYNSATLSVWDYDFAKKEIKQDKRSILAHGFGSVIKDVPDSLIKCGFVHPDSARAYLEMYKKLFSGAKTAEGVFRVQTADRQSWWYESIRYTTIYDNNGRPYAAIGISEDVTERREQEMAYTKWQKEISVISNDNSTVFGWNLSRDSLDGSEKKSFKAVKIMDPKAGLNKLAKVYADDYVFYEDSSEIIRFMNRERLIGMYYDDVFSDDMDYREINDAGEYSWMHLSVQLVQYPDTDEIKAYVMSRDIDKEKREELELIARSERDSLTDAYNRDAFENRVQKILENSEAGVCHAFLMMDIDEFKAVNDTFGHDAGDSILEELTKSIRSVLRFDDIVGRIGGDEFMVCMKDVSYDAVVEKKAQQLCEMLRRRLSDEVMVSLSMGISVYPRDGITFETLYKSADTALYFTKENGKDGFNFYTPGMLAEPKPTETKAAPGTINMISEPLPKMRMLIVESNDDDRQTLIDAFEDEYAIITAKTGTGALSQIKRYGSSISIILLELEVPQLSGYDIISQLKNDGLLAQMPVIVISAKDDRQTYLDVISSGAADIVTKPIDGDLAQIRVRSVLTRIQNERQRAQKNYLRLQGAEEERYRRVLAATGTVVIQHDWQNNIFSYDANISQYIGANFDNRPLDKIFIDDGVCTARELDRLNDLERELVKNPELDTIEKKVLLTIPGGDKHYFRIQIIKMSAEYELTEKMLITLNDVNDAAIAENALKTRAERNPLTGLYNRESFFEKAGELIYAERPNSYIMAAFDINNFKAINEQYGTDVGDEILKKMAKIGSAAFESIGGLTCHISADIFAGVYPSSTSAVDFITEQRTLVMDESNLQVPVSFSVGRYVIEDLSLSVSAMYDRANMAKKSIKGRYDVHTAYYNASMREEFLREQMIIGSMEQALRDNQFVVYYQPQYNHSTGAMVGAEALVRWNHPMEGIVSPANFIPIFERNGFIYKMDAYVWESTCSMLRDQIDLGVEVLPISVNVSRFDIYQPDLFHVITSLMAKYDLPTELLRLEITETAFSTSPKQIIKTVKKFVDFGFIVEIDDFGSGYSSLNTLKDVPAQMIKLDMRFMEDSETTQRGGSIINSVVRMAKWLYMPVIAEGVETMEQADFLKSIGCDYVQGYLYAKPMPEEDFIKLLGSSEKEKRMETLRTISTLDANAFWDPKSIETLIFNSYVGGASVIELSDNKLEYLRLNEKYMKELNIPGVTEQNVLAANPLGFCSEEHRKNVIKVMNEAAEADAEREFEIFNFYSMSKTSCWLRCRCMPIGRSGDRVLFYLAAENITEAKYAEQRIKETSEQLETIMDTIDSGVCAYAIEDYYHGFVLFANTQYYNMFGYTEEQFKAEVTTIFDVIHPDEKKRVLRHTLDAMSREGELISYDYRGIKRDGNLVIVHGDSKIISVAGEDNPVLLVVTSDVTSRVEETQAAELRQYTDALMGFYDEIYEFNNQENTVKRLDNALDATFAPAGELEPSIFTIINMLIHPDDHQKVLELYHKFTEGELAKTEEIEFRLYSDAQPIWMRCRVILLTDTRCLVMIHDETKEKNEALAAERYHMILGLMTDEEAPFGIVLIDTATSQYELISSVAQTRSLPSKGHYDGMVEFLVGLIPEGVDKEPIRQKILLKNIITALEQGNGAYSFSYDFDNEIAHGHREVVVRYSDEWKNELIMAVRLKND